MNPINSLISQSLRPVGAEKSQNVTEYKTTRYGSVRIDSPPANYPIDQTYDSFGRRIHYLRISLTDVCNLRCVYCMPEKMSFRPREELMSDVEIMFLVRVAASLGVDKIRLTGGEPTIRPGIVDLVAQISQTEGIKDVAMTTNAILLDKLAKPLAQAGLSRVNVSIDTLDPEKFHKITRWGHIEDVWRGIEAAREVGLTPVKLNCVVVRNFNEEDMIDLARLTFEQDLEVRFIEMMPFGEINEFQQTNVVSFKEMRQRIEKEFGSLEEVGYDFVDPSRPFRIPGAVGTLGFINSVTEPFCEGCGRIRITADGKLRLCLLKDNEVDLLGPLRAGASFEDMRLIMAEGAYQKPWGHDLAGGSFAENRAMNQIGG